MRKIYFILFIYLLIIVACDNPVYSPGPTTPTTTTPAQPIPPPVPHNPGVTFSWVNTRGILLFPGTQDTEIDITRMHNRLKRANWPTITWHVCAEVDQWARTSWRDGPDTFSTENLENLERFLDTTARLGDQVLLDVFCTVRDDPSWLNKIVYVDDEEIPQWKHWVITVAEAATKYNNIAIHVANEWGHPSSGITLDMLRGTRDLFRMSGFKGPIGTDDNAHPGKLIYRSSLLSLGFWPDLHPWRNPDPTKAQIDKMINNNGGALVISEPTGYSATTNSGLLTTKKQQIIDYFNNCEHSPAGQCVIFYHSDCPGLEGLICEPEWIIGEPK